ncbi:CaiB/BaiF CoA-transferase family protein [Paralcaligenes ureilyticus]|uniref:Crotonobetainyl-CoA:carnitine CoA-transferase CaiB-like acyl-CoA transferase n=1 Tax=Paralcaligenes ureilyticus TaxID=627131 RepID=A0A4R3MDM0_9BURK|nr:CoA transferase [Paralcaligenes ureilyticus]TCT09625.1 crotonobetainyl-CoA:carnitine CoA-transferase CaiB-like acyl-CoA transferase [Paralcaligenes ureilyticus]
MDREQHSQTEVTSLANLTVLQWGESVACGFAAKLLTDFGARVILVKDTIPSPHQHIPDPLFHDYLDHDKQVIDLDSSSPSGRNELSTLIKDADILLEDHAPGSLSTMNLTYDAIASVNPAIIMASVTPFGQNGPYSNFHASDLEISYLSGLAHLTPRDITPGNAEQPPLKMPASLVSIYAGISAAGAALAALHNRRASGAGTHVDISTLESLLPTLRRELALSQYEDITASRFMRVWKLAPWGVKPCKDGYVFLQVVEEHHWKGLVDMMGSPEWATDPRYLNPDYRFQERAEIEHLLTPWLMQQTRRTLAWEAQRRAVPFAPVNNVADILQIPQLHHREFFVTGSRSDQRPYISLSHPFKFSVCAAPPAAQAARPLEPDVRQKNTAPLAGVRIIDFGHVWAGPYCAATLADMGADVIKIESQHRIDIHRRQGPYPNKAPGLNHSAVWNAQNRGKRSVTLNLSTPEGRKLAKDLIAQSDVVIENFSPGVMKRLGLDYQSLCKVKPDIIMASLSAFGQDGPQKAYVGYGPSLDAWAGLNVLTAYRDGAPNALGGVFPDTGSALFAVVAILAALSDRHRHARGQYIDVSELEVSILLAADRALDCINGGEPSKTGNTDPAAIHQGVYRCKDDQTWIAVSALDLGTWKKLCMVLNRPDLRDNPDMIDPIARSARKYEIDQVLSDWCSVRTPLEAMQQLQRVSVPAGVAHDVPTLLQDPQLKERGYFKTVYHPEMGDQVLYGPIWRMRNMPDCIQRPAPTLGQHNREVLRGWLGMTDPEIEALTDKKVVY